MSPINLIGRQLQDFVIQESIGRGGMAHVYRARQVSVNRDVAVKIIQIDEERGDDAFMRRFAQEAEMVASLEHIHILPIFAYGIEGTIAYIAMRLLRGGSVADILDDGPMVLVRAAELFDQVAQGLAFAHSKGVVHRDLKPSNMMLDETGNAYLTDFGLAKLISGGEDLTKTGNIVGTPNYMSPEQLRGERLDHRSDIYSLGVVLYHMVTGQQPFEATDGEPVSIIYKHLEQAPEPPSHINPEVPAEVEAVILRALSKRPADRFDNAIEMSRELKRALRISISTSSYPAVHPDLRQAHADVASDDITAAKLRVARRKNYTLPLVGALAALIIVIVAVILLTQQAAPTPIHPEVLAGETGRAENTVPSPDEIRIAQQQLGSKGFIGHIACNQTSEYHAAQNREIRDQLSEYGLRSEFYDSNTDEYLQITLIEKARAEGAIGLIICVLNNAVLDESLKSVQKAQMPLVIMNPGDDNYGGVALVGDNYQMGLKTGQVAGKVIHDELAGRADVVILDYPDLPIIIERANGLSDGVLQNAPDARIVGRYQGGTRDFGYESISRILNQGVTFDVILSINDAGAFGAIDALVEANINPKSVIIYSVDAESLAREYIRDDYYMRGSLDPGRTEFSSAATNAMVKLLAGSAIPETILVPPGEVVTKAILDQAE